tara:strand:+ start:18 stop:323 length:306 start_codon:yes stop_codon:yes gene_type:complete
MIIQRITEDQFIKEFEAIRPNNFSSDALSAMYDYLCQYSEDLGVPYALDVIALCTQFSEYTSLAEVLGDYSSLTGIECLDDLSYYTIVIEIPEGGLIIQDF